MIGDSSVRCDDFETKTPIVLEILKGNLIFFSEPFLSSFFISCSGRSVTPAPDCAISSKKFGLVDSIKMFGV